MNRLHTDRPRRHAVIATLLALFGARLLHAQQDSARGAFPVTIDAFVSASYTYNINRPISTTNGLRVFDVDNGNITLDVAELVARHAAEHPGDAGFRIDVTAGSTIPRATSSRGLFRDDDGSAPDIDLQQAYLSYALPFGEGLRLDIGKFVTPLGYELIDGYDGYNDNATRSFLFGYAIPFTHTGVRLTCVASDQFTVTAMAVNGWDVARDNNRTKSAGLQTVFTPSDQVGLALCYIGGAERDNSSDLRQVLDLVATWRVSDRFSLGLNSDYGVEKNAVAAGRNSIWRGGALYAKLALAGDFSLALRGEYFEDPDGARTGTGQILRELTLTPSYQPTSTITFRADLRADRSSSEVFEKNDGTSRWQPTILLQGVCSF